MNRRNETHKMAAAFTDFGSQNNRETAKEMIYIIQNKDDYITKTKPYSYKWPILDYLAAYNMGKPSNLTPDT